MNSSTPVNYISMDLASFIQQICTAQPVSFQDSLTTIQTHYHYQPTEFHNGLNADRIINAPGENEGSCKLLAFAQLHGLTEAQTLRLFGDFYRDVLKHPEGTDHKNIRNFMRYGWSGIVFKGTPLTTK